VFFLTFPEICLSKNRGITLKGDYCRKYSNEIEKLYSEESLNT